MVREPSCSWPVSAAGCRNEDEGGARNNHVSRAGRAMFSEHGWGTEWLAVTGNLAAAGGCEAQGGGAVWCRVGWGKGTEQRCEQRRVCNVRTRCHWQPECSTNAWGAWVGVSHGVGRGAMGCGYGVRARGRQGRVNEHVGQGRVCRRCSAAGRVACHQPPASKGARNARNKMQGRRLGVGCLKPVRSTRRHRQAECHARSRPPHGAWSCPPAQHPQSKAHLTLPEPPYSHTFAPPHTF